MPRTPLQFKQMKDERKLSILESALFLFAIHGKDSVTIDMICQKAKCSHGLAYHYFKNVDQIYAELITSETYKNIIDKIDGFNFEEDPYFQLIKKTKILLSFVNEPKLTVSFALIVLADRSKNSICAAITKLISLGQQKGQVTGGDPKDILETYYYFFKGLYLTLLNEKHPVIKMPSIDNVIQIFEK